MDGSVEFTQIEFLAVADAVAPLARAHAAGHHEIDAVRPDRSVGERTDEVVAAGGAGALR